MAILVVNTNEKLRVLLALGLYAPNDLIWVKITKEAYESNCPIEIGNAEELIKQQFYATIKGNDVYLAVGRSLVTKKYITESDFDKYLPAEIIEETKEIIDEINKEMIIETKYCVKIPTGNYQILSDEEFLPWVEYLGADNFFIAVPQDEIIE